jgi:hypothetical protein
MALRLNVAVDLVSTAALAAGKKNMPAHIKAGHIAPTILFNAKITAP